MPSNARSIPEGKKQVNFNIPEQLLEKVKAVSFMEGCTNSDVFQKAVELYISTYEKKRGKIRVRKKGKGLDL